MAIQKADPNLPRNVLLGLVGVEIVGSIVLQWGLPRVVEAIASQEPTQALRSLQILVIATFAPALPMAYFVYKVARRVKTSQRFPPQGMTVIRDTQVQTGEAARRLGNALIAVSLVLASVALFGIVYLPYAIAQLGLGA